MAINVKRTARLQWKVDTIKNCTYLQCSLFLLYVFNRMSIVAPHLEAEALRFFANNFFKGLIK